MRYDILRCHCKKNGETTPRNKKRQTNGHVFIHGVYVMGQLKVAE
jgi:hypothetical protein